MAHQITLSDEQYETITHFAERRGLSLDEVVARWVEEARAETAVRGMETDDWLRHLGVSDAEIEASKQRVRQEAGMPYDADSSGAVSADMTS